MGTREGWLRAGKKYLSSEEEWQPAFSGPCSQPAFSVPAANFLYFFVSVGPTDNEDEWQRQFSKFQTADGEAGAFAFFKISDHHASILPDSPIFAPADPT